MNISEVKTAFKVGDFFLRKDESPNLIDINYCDHISNEILTDNNPRVYLFVADGQIKKIGGSTAKGGIKNGTMSFYINSQTGSPGPSRFILHWLIYEILNENKKVEVFTINSERVYADVKGLFGKSKTSIASFKEMEEKCIKDYFDVEGRYPDWNFQENGDSYPQKYQKKYADYRTKKAM